MARQELHTLTLHSLEVVLELAELWHQWKVVDNELFADLENEIFALVSRCCVMLTKEDTEGASTNVASGGGKRHSQLSGRDEQVYCQVLLCALRVLRVLAPVSDPHWRSLVDEKDLAAGDVGLPKKLFLSLPSAPKRPRREVKLAEQLREAEQLRKAEQETSSGAMHLIKDRSMRHVPVFAEETSALHQRQPLRPRIKAIAPCVHRAIEAIGARAEQRGVAPQGGEVGVLEPREMLRALSEVKMGENTFSKVFHEGWIKPSPLPLPVSAI